MMCDKCGLQWDVNDENGKPPCQPKVITRTQQPTQMVYQRSAQGERVMNELKKLFN